VDGLIVISRFTHFAALAVLFGGALFRLCVEPRRGDQPEQWPRMVDVAAAAVALLSALGWLVGVAATMAGGWGELLAADAVAAVLVETRFGRLWIGRLALAAAILGLVLMTRRRTQPWEVAVLLLSAVLTASLVAVGHGSVGAGLLGPIHVVGDALHLLCACAWLGGLCGLGIVLHSAGRRHDDASRDLVRDALPRFSRLGYLAVGLLLVTGVLNAIVLVPRPDSFITTAYGQVLLVKIGLVAVMIAIAIRNRFVLAPAILAARASDGSEEETASLFRSVAVEQAVGALVLATVAILGTLHPLR
jgi:copper resistance protein D